MCVIITFCSRVCVYVNPKTPLHHRSYLLVLDVQVQNLRDRYGGDVHRTSDVMPPRAAEIGHMLLFTVIMLLSFN